MEIIQTVHMVEIKECKSSRDDRYSRDSKDSKNVTQDTKGFKRWHTVKRSVTVEIKEAVGKDSTDRTDTAGC